MNGHVERRVGKPRIVRGKPVKPRITYTVRVFVDKAHGGPRRETHGTFAHEYEAKDELRRVLGVYRRSETDEPTTETMAELLERWMRDAATPNHRKTTLRSYRIAIDKHLVPELGQIPAAKLRPADVAAWQAQLLGTHKPKSVRDYRGVLSAALAWAVKLGDLPGNSVAAVDTPRLSDDRLSPPDLATMRRYVAALEATRYYVPVLLAAATGMRRGEVLALRWSDVDLATGEVQITRQLSQAGADVYFGPPKTKRGTRSLVLPAFAVAVLSQRRVLQANKARALGLRWSASWLICAKDDGALLKPDQLTHGLRAMYLRKKLEPIRFHMLRHAVASDLLQRERPDVVRDQLGHAHITTTLGIYGHLMPGAQASAAERYNEAWQAVSVEDGHRMDTDDGVVVEIGQGRQT